jgi:hypothetical protein
MGTVRFPGVILTKFSAFSLTSALLLLSVLCSFSVHAQQAPTIGQLSYLDLHYMEQQRTTLDDLARARLGRQFSGSKGRDLALLQALLDKELVRGDQKRELQAMGVVMGDLLAVELNLHWVIYEDPLGRSRALRYRDTENYLFPMTMISRRREAGNLSTVDHIYQRAVDIIKPQLPTLPFQ